MAELDPAECRRLSTKDEIEAATPAETDAIIVLVEELPFDFVDHEQSGTAIDTTEKDETNLTLDVEQQSVASDFLVLHPDLPTFQTSEQTKVDIVLEPETISQPCAVCLSLIIPNVPLSSSFEGQDLLNSICSCLSIKRSPCVNAAKDLSVCERCHSLISDTLDYRRTLERVKQLLDETIVSLKGVLLGSCKEQLEDAKRTDNLESIFEGDFGKFRLSLLNCWSGTKLELKKHNLNLEGSVHPAKRPRNSDNTEDAPPRQIFREQTAGERVLRRCITKPSYFRDMIMFDHSAITVVKPEHQEISVDDSMPGSNTQYYEAPHIEEENQLETTLPHSETSENEINETSQDEDDASDVEVQVPKKPRKSRRLYECSNCPKKFISNKRLALHASTSHGVEIPTKNVSCRFCSEDFNNALQPQEASDGSSKDYVCTLPQCGKRYGSLISLHSHHERTCPQNTKARSSGTAKLSCSVCSKEFITQVALSHHIKSVHERSFKLYCEICGLGFQAINMLKRHVMYVHSSEKRYECEICQAKFKRSHQLLYHRRKHTGELPFKCEICARAFKQPDKLKQHMAVHSSKETPCPLCDKMFASKQYVTNHIRDTHKGVRKQKSGPPNEPKTAAKPMEETHATDISTTEEVALPESVTVIVQSEPVIQDGPTEEIFCEEFSFQRIA